MPDEKEPVEQQESPEEKNIPIPPIELKTPINITLSGTINPADKTINGNTAFIGKNNTTSVGIDAALGKDTEKITSVTVDTSQDIDCGRGNNLSLAGNLTHTDENNCGSATVGYTYQNDDLIIDGKGSVNIGGEEGTQYNVDISASDTIAGVNSNITLHSDTQEHSVAIRAKKILLNPNNINGHKDNYQERKEGLQESGDRWSIDSKVGYSQEEKSVYTENSLMYRADDNNFLTANYNRNGSSEEIKATGDFQHVRFDYTYNQTKNDEDERTSHSLDTMVKHGKNQYSYTLETGETVTSDGTQVEHSDVKAKVMLNRTEHGEFQEGFNAQLDGGLHTTDGKIDGYSGALDIAYNKYGKDEKSNDFLVRGQLGFTHNTTLHEVRTSIDLAQRLNGCRTIFEESVSYNYTNNHSDPSLGIFSVNAGIYQQVGKNFGDASIYTQLEYQHRTSSNYTNVFRIYSGAKVKATDKVVLNFENCYGTDNGWSGNIGLTYNF